MKDALRTTSLLTRLLATLVLLGAVMAMSTCSDVADALNPLAFHPDSCAEFSFWRNDTLLVKDLKVGVARSSTETNAGCRFQNWTFEDDHSWMWYGLSGVTTMCDDFDAEIHVGKRYWEITTGNVTGTVFKFADGEWKLHEVNGKVDKIIDAGTFEFEFNDAGSCP
jgi:hypothetical protein